MFSLFAKSLPKSSAQFWCLSVFLVLVFLTGGASRVDVQSLILLRPLSVLAVTVALISLRKEHLVRYWRLLAGFGLIALLVISHLIPIPPGLWNMLPGHGEFGEIEKLAQVESAWRPLTLTPMNGWHTLVSLAAPLAVILWGVQLSWIDLRRLAVVLIGLIILSGLFGLLQVIGDPNGPLYFYRITNNGSAVGLFSNRNHAAVLLNCIFPLCVILAARKAPSKNEKKFLNILAIIIGALILPLILVTGSRLGLILAAVSLFGSAIIYYNREIISEKGSPPDKKLLIAGGTITIIMALLILTALYFSRAQAVERFFDMGVGDQIREDAWKVSLDMFWKYFPFGSGAGSFVEAFQIEEPTGFLSPTYLNRAHNDWIETAVTFGLPGLILLGASIIIYVVKALQFWRNRQDRSDRILFGQSGILIIILLGMASFSDYPLRTPSMLCLFAIMALWVSAAHSGEKVSTSS